MSRPNLMLLVDAVEGFFAEAVQAPLETRRFRSVVDLQAAINRFLAETNAGTEALHNGPQTPTKSSPPSDEGTPSVRFIHEVTSARTWSMVLSASLQYDVLNDFEPVCLLAIRPLLIVGRKTMPATNLQELIAWLKENLVQGLARRCWCLFSARRLLFPDDDRDPFPGHALPRRRSGGTTMVAGHIDLTFPRRRSRWRASAAATSRPSRLRPPPQAAPDIPTVDDAGFAGIPHLDLAGVLGAQGHVEGRRRHAQCRDRQFLGRGNGDLAAYGFGLEPRCCAISRRRRRSLHLHKAEIEKWWPIIKAANIKPELPFSGSRRNIP